MRCAYVSKMLRTIDDVTGAIIDAAIHIHRTLGPGMLESVYEPAMASLLARRGLKVERQKVIGVEFDGIRVDKAFVVDLLVENRVVVEIKSVETLPRVSFKQVLTYLRLMKLTVGLLLNFGAPTMKEGIHRIVNGHSSEGSVLRINQPSPEGRVTLTEDSGPREP